MKVGDEVKVIDVLAEYAKYYNKVGLITKINEFSNIPYTVVFNDPNDFNYFSEHELKVLA